MKLIDIIIVTSILALSIFIIYQSFDKRKKSCAQGCDSCGYSCNSFTKEYLEKYKKERSEKISG